MQVDYIIIGVGLAGISFCEQLKANNKTFVVFDNSSQQSSIVAGGLYNPVVLKRFTSVWNSALQLKTALPMYANLEKRLGVKLDYKMSVYRKFASLEEQNNWFAACDKSKLAEYLSPDIIKNTHPKISAQFGFGEVLQTGRIDVKCLVDAYKKELLSKELFFESDFDYQHIETGDEGVQYRDISAKHIVFAEGFGLVKNPFFKNLPLVPTKGELLIIEVPDLKINYVLKAGVFLIPMHDNLYIVGATYQRDDTTHEVTSQAKDTLLTKLETLINCSYSVVNQVAGIRPTVKDRRPLVGQHARYKNMYVLNGLGSRGVMIGPYVASALYNFIEHQTPLDTEIDIKRFL